MYTVELAEARRRLDLVHQLVVEASNHGTHLPILEDIETVLAGRELDRSVDGESWASLL